MWKWPWRCASQKTHAAGSDTQEQDNLSLVHFNYQHSITLISSSRSFKRCSPPYRAIGNSFPCPSHIGHGSIPTLPDHATEVAWNYASFLEARVCSLEDRTLEAIVQMQATQIDSLMKIYLRARICQIPQNSWRCWKRNSSLTCQKISTTIAVSLYLCII